MSSTKHNYALIDCNNFFASCEQVFNPKLAGKPLVILSSNDGCIIARSKEAKALGIPMGAPSYEYRDLFKARSVITLSCNFALYGDMSQRVMSTLGTFGYEVEVYSVDEAFLKLPLLPSQELETIAQEIRNRIKQWTGIPTAVGIAPTKTLAKAVNEAAKKKTGIAVAVEPGVITALLKSMEVEEIWGIGRRLSAYLRSEGILTAFAFREQPDHWIKKNLSVEGLRIALELRGTSCFEDAEEEPIPRSITSSRTFGQKITRLEELKEAVATFVSKAAEKLRRHEAKASELSVFLGSTYVGDPNFAHMRLPLPTAYTPELISCSGRLLTTLFRPGSAYKKAGILLGGISSVKDEQPDLWLRPDPKRESLMELVDQINATRGKKSLYFAAEGTSAAWHPRATRRSPAFTTSWDDLPSAKT